VMDWKTIGKAVADSAPILGGLLGGPAGGAAGALIASALGTAGDPEAVMRKIQSDPVVLMQIKQLEAENRRLEIVASQQRSEAESMKTQQAMAINAQKHEMDMAKGAQDMRNKAMTTDMNVQATAAKTAASMQKPKNQDGL